ncbi:MAG TPA: RNA-guided endonuclease TnpB family protein [Blastocatellia bacterium]|nr:RNA-guided endonuclease TnpB family protein [Blastocatellia bacterium]
MIVQKAFKYRFFPTDEQAAQLAKTFGCARYVYNQALEYRTTAWQQEKISIGYRLTAAKLTEWKMEPEKAFLSEVSSVVLQQSLRNLDTAFTNFFEKRAQYPKFKSRRARQSARYATNAFTFRDAQITLAKQSTPLEIVWSRPLPDDAKILNLTVSRDTSERYFVSILVETDVQPLRRAKAEVGIDVGIKTLATTSDGEKLENPRPLVKREQRLKKLQRRLSRKARGSNNRKKARLKVARLHAKISDARRDTLQKFTTKIIRKNQAIFVEGLNVAGMVQNHNLAKHIVDAAFGEIFRELEYKAKWYGRTYLPLDRFFPSSKLCSSCGHLLDELPLPVREWDCPVCGVHHDRDINAAINIKLVGQYLQKTTGSDARKVTPTRYQRRR